MLIRVTHGGRGCHQAEAGLPEHHFRWLKNNDADVITAGKLDDFFTVADEFSLLAEDLEPALEDSVIIP
ncbi:hypothetical protein K2A10_004720 [Salmonella enterica subsp. enterica serovar Concord]|nr:hypothetical protein [Salmonella enterica subsp. enterica serovar Concord]